MMNWFKYLYRKYSWCKRINEDYFGGRIFSTCDHNCKICKRKPGKVAITISCLDVWLYEKMYVTNLSEYQSYEHWSSATHIPTPWLDGNRIRNAVYITHVWSGTLLLWQHATKENLMEKKKSTPKQNFVAKG